jgi:AcrR family transcriptional regulator
MMTKRSGRAPRRTDALSRERIVEAAVELLDEHGEAGLTVRALTERLATGSGTIYWHVRNLRELLSAATDAVIAIALDNARIDPEGAVEAKQRLPRDRLRTIALKLFDAIDEHPWVAAPLSDSSWPVTTPRSEDTWQAAKPQILESVGQQIRALGVPEHHWFTATSVMVQYILGAASQNAAYAVRLQSAAARSEFLDAVATTWAQLDPDDYPFTRAVANQMRTHDDHEQFLAGIDLFLTGITALTDH